MTTLSGICSDGFGRVADVLSSAADELAPGGAAFAVYRDGKPLIDLWTGHSRPGVPWTDDTPTVLMSATKGITALAVQILTDRGLVDVDRPMADYWPGFAVNGKEAVLVRHVLSHTAGLTSVPGHTAIFRGDGGGWDREADVIAALESATPSWTPGTRVGYHGFTFGWLLGELVRRVTGISLGAFIRQEIAEPLKLDLGLGASGDARRRLARVIGPQRTATDAPEVKEFWRRATDPEDALGAMLLAVDGECALTIVEPFFNDGPGANLELGSSTGVATARALAGMYQALACPEGFQGTRLVSSESVQMFAQEQVAGNDQFSGLPCRWALGYQMSGSEFVSFGPSAGAFGHGGFGGQVGWADPQRAISGGFVRSHLVGFDLSNRLIDALYAALD